MKVENIDLKKAEQNGWTAWKKYGKNRLYFNTKNSDALNIDRYNSGNIRRAELNGEKISNSEAYKIIDSKVFIDLDTMELHIDSEDTQGLIEDFVKAEIEKITISEDPEPKEEKEDTKMKRYIITSNKPVYGANGSHVEVFDLDGKDASENDRIFSDWSDIQMTEEEADRLDDIFNEQDTYEDILKEAKVEGLIEDYEVQEVEEN